MCYIFKIAMSAKRSVIIHQTSAFVILLDEVSLYFLAIYVVGVQGLVLFRSAGYPRNAIDTHTTGF